MNKVVLKGRLCADPDVRYTQVNGEQMAISRYRIAVNRRGKDAGADFINCVAFGKNGEFAEKYLKKGQEILISGHIQTGEYVNKDNQKVFTTDVVIEEHEFCGSKQESRPSAPANAIPSDIPTDELPFR